MIDVNLKEMALFAIVLVLGFSAVVCAEIGAGPFNKGSSLDPYTPAPGAVSVESTH